MPPPDMPAFCVLSALKDAGIVGAAVTDAKVVGGTDNVAAVRVVAAARLDVGEAELKGVRFLGIEKGGGFGLVVDRVCDE